ncbi:hypothetical protein KEJ34_08560, partial [Candidatus Bathyarchaeota archaeon]|nr:hypothetical protein [Candidatus Bathyarchaeota archaeon]
INTIKNNTDGSPPSKDHNTISPPRLNEGELPLKVTEPMLYYAKIKLSLANFRLVSLRIGPVV